MKPVLLLIFLLISCQPNIKQEEKQKILQDKNVRGRYDSYNYPNTIALQRIIQPAPDIVFEEPEPDGSLDSLITSLLHSEDIVFDAHFQPKHKKSKFIVDRKYKENPIAPTSEAIGLPDNPKNEFRVFEVCEFDSMQILIHKTGEANLFSINDKWFNLQNIRIENEEDSEVGGGLHCNCEQIRKFYLGDTNYLLITSSYEGCNGTFCMIVIYLLYDIKNQKLYSFSAYPSRLGFGYFGNINGDNQLDFMYLEYPSLESVVYDADTVEVKMIPLSQNIQGKFVPLKDKRGNDYYVLARFKGGFFATNSTKIVKKHWFK